MKTVTQIKDDLAKELGYPSYQEYIKEINGNFYCAERLEKFYDEVIKRTSKEALKNSSENCTNHFFKQGYSFDFLDQQSILNESNIPEV